MTPDLRNAEEALPARARKNIEDNRSVLPWYARTTTGNGLIVPITSREMLAR
jgi:hypothetical protein